jgi:DNA-binding transcriptional LysR family regulator
VIELRLIRHAQALGQHGNFARAAEALHLTQPSLSRSIATLEAALGVPLFDRSPKGVTPTAFGRVLLERGDIVLKRAVDLRREIELLAGLDTGSLAVGAGPYMAESSVATAVARMAMAHPRLRIKCISADPTEVVREVLAERLDVGVSAAPGLAQDARLVVEELPAQRAYLACRPGHPLTREPALTLKRVFEFPLVTTVLRGAHAALASSAGQATAAQAPGAEDYVPPILVNTVALARMIARESDAVVPMTAATLADDLAAGRLVVLAVDAPAMRTNGGIFYLRDRTLAPAARRFIDVLRAVEAEAQAVEATLSASLAAAAQGQAAVLARV